ncbi:MAG: helix-turn-helix domain-containing protein [Oscillospiraceae bacterium]
MKLFTISEVAKILRTNPASVYELVHAGFLPAMKLGQYKVREESLERFLAECEGKDFSDLSNVKNLTA